MQEYIWQGIRLLVPKDWELLGYSRRRESGKLHFADRRQYRLELTWRTLPGKPDMDRLLRDYQSRLHDDEKIVEIRPDRLRDWYGFTIRKDNPPTHESRMTHFFEKDFLLVEVVFLWPETAASSLRNDVLESIAYSDTRSEPSSRWRCFGLSLEIDSRFSIDTVNSRPALAAMSFRSCERIPAEIEISRRGFVDDRIRESVRDNLRQQIPAEFTFLRDSTSIESGHTIHSLFAGRRSGWILNLLRGRSRIYFARAWICPRDGRLYYGSLRYPTKSGKSGAAVPYARPALSCCPYGHFDLISHFGSMDSSMLIQPGTAETP